MPSNCGGQRAAFRKPLVPEMKVTSAQHLYDTDFDHGQHISERAFYRSVDLNFALQASDDQDVGDHSAKAGLQDIENGRLVSLDINCAARRT